MKKSMMIVMVAVVSIVTLSHAAIVVNYEFNEAAGSMTNAVDSAGSAIADWTHDANWGLDGSGNMVISGNLGRKNQFLSTSSIAGGTAYYRIDFASWDVGSINTLFGMRLRDAGNSVNKLHDVAYTSGGGNLNSDSSGAWTWLGGGIPNPNSGAYANGMSVILSADLDADTYTVWRDIGRTGSYTLLNTLSLNIDGITDFGQVNALTFDPGGGTVTIDRIVLGTDFTEISTIPEPATLGLVTAFGGAVLFIRRRFMI